MATLAQVYNKFSISSVREKLGSMSSTALLLLMIRIGSAGIGIVLQVLIARYYGADILGYFFLALSLAAVLATILTAGFPWIVAPVVARSEAESDPGLLRAFLRTAQKHLVATSILIAVPVGAVIWHLPGLTNELSWALLIAVATAPVYAVMWLNGGLANARKRFIIANVPELLLRPLFLAAFVGVALVLSMPVDTTVIVAFNLAIATALAIWMSLILSRQSRADLLRAQESRPVAREQTRQWRNLAFPMVLATLFVNLFADLDILMIGSIMPARETGIFGVSIKLTFLVAFATQIVHQVMLRDASDAYLLNNTRALQATIRNANQFALTITMSAFVFLILFGSHVLEVFGAEFTDGYACVVGLMIAQVIRAAAGPAIHVLMISENQRSSIPVYIASTLLLLVCNLLFVPFFGLIGAAAAVICTTLFWTISLERIVKRMVGIPVSVLAR